MSIYQLNAGISITIYTTYKNVIIKTHKDLSSYCAYSFEQYLVKVLANCLFSVDK